MPTTTSNYSLLKPLVASATDQDLWGGYLNDDMDDIDALLRQGITIETQSSQTLGFVADASISVKKLYPCDATSSGFTATIPLAATAGNGATVFIKKTDASANIITLARSGSDTLDGSTSLTITVQNGVYALVSDGVSRWNNVTSQAIPDASETVKGIVELATIAEVLAGTDTVRAVTPAGLAGSASITTNGYYKLAGGLIVQWGFYNNSVSGDESVPITLPIPFITSLFSTVAMARNTAGSPVPELIMQYKSNTLTDITYYACNIAGSSPINGFYWFAVGA